MHVSKHASGTRTAPAARVPCVEAGFSLVEAIVASVVAIIAILGLSYTFGIGRGMVNRYEVARAALGVAQDRLEMSVALPRDSDSLAVGFSSPTAPFVYEGTTVGDMWWHVEAYDHPDILGATDMKRVIVAVRFHNGSLTDSLKLDRLVGLP